MWLFVLFFAIGLILTISGFVLDIAVLNLAGTIMIFGLGLGLLNDGIDYKTGVVESYQYGNDLVNFSGSLPSNVSDNAYVVGVVTDAVYGSYDDAGENRFGWLLMSMGALAFCLSLFRL